MSHKLPLLFGPLFAVERRRCELGFAVQKERIVLVSGTEVLTVRDMALEPRCCARRVIDPRESRAPASGIKIRGGVCIIAVEQVDVTPAGHAAAVEEDDERGAVDVGAILRCRRIGLEAGQYVCSVAGHERGDVRSIRLTIEKSPVAVVAETDIRAHHGIFIDLYRGIDSGRRRIRRALPI